MLLHITDLDFSRARRKSVTWARIGQKRPSHGLGWSNEEAKACSVKGHQDAADEQDRQSLANGARSYR